MLNVSSENQRFFSEFFIFFKLTIKFVFCCYLFCNAGLNSSPDSLNPFQTSSSTSPPTDSKSQSLVERFSAKHTSKIPVLVLPKHKSRNRSLISGNQQRALKAQIRDSISHHNSNPTNNSKVDQIIADLLIEALNHSTDIGIEFIKTPQSAPSQSHPKVNHTKRLSLNSRRSNGLATAGSGSNGSGKRSSHGSAKYQQVFDSIPEEKSGSFSYESPSDEKASPVERASSKSNDNLSEMDLKTFNQSTSSLATNVAHQTDEPNVRTVVTKVASGKAAIESDQDKSETWFGCFGRTHVDSPVDGLLTEEGILKIMHNTSLVV